MERIFPIDQLSEYQKLFHAQGKLGDDKDLHHLAKDCVAVSTSQEEARQKAQSRHRKDFEMRAERLKGRISSTTEACTEKLQVLEQKQVAFKKQVEVQKEEAEELEKQMHLSAPAVKLCRMSVRILWTVYICGLLAEVFFSAQSLELVFLSLPPVFSYMSSITLVVAFSFLCWQVFDTIERPLYRTRFLMAMGICGLLLMSTTTAFFGYMKGIGTDLTQSQAMGDFDVYETASFSDDKSNHSALSYMLMSFSGLLVISGIGLMAKNGSEKLQDVSKQKVAYEANAVMLAKAQQQLGEVEEEISHTKGVMAGLRPTLKAIPKQYDTDDQQLVQLCDTLYDAREKDNALLETQKAEWHKQRQAIIDSLKEAGFSESDLS